MDICYLNYQLSLFYVVYYCPISTISVLWPGYFTSIMILQIERTLLWNILFHLSSNQLFLSLSISHTHKHTFSFSLSLPSFFLSLTHTQTQTLILSLSNSLWSAQIALSCYRFDVRTIQNLCIKLCVIYYVLTHFI